MRKTVILCILLGIAFSFSIASAAKTPEPVAWEWLVGEAARGVETITLAGDVLCDDESAPGLAPAGTLRIEGGGFSITGARVESGTVLFNDVKLDGLQGVGDEDGGSALTMTGDGAIAVLMGTTRAQGGASGPDGERGGSGVSMQGKGQGLILRSTAAATGGVGRILGGHGIDAAGCDANVLMADGSVAKGNLGLAEGGHGLHLPSCGKATLSDQASATGGKAQNTGGSGLFSFLCDACERSAPLSLGGQAMAIGAVGQAGGHGISVARKAPGEQADLSLGGQAMLFGGDGMPGGAALQAENAALSYAGAVQAFGGQYFGDTPSEALMLTGCKALGDAAALTVTQGKRTETYPAGEIAPQIAAALSLRSDRYAPAVIEDGLAVRATETKLDALSVERGNTSQAKVGGTGLKIFLYSGTLETRMQFQQRLMEDGEGGIRLVLIATRSTEWPTVDTTTAALRKLLEMGIGQLAYTTAAPTHFERAIDIAALVEAIDAYEAAHDLELAKVLLGTADDAVIFVPPDGTRDYQEALMPEIARPVA